MVKNTETQRHLEFGNAFYGQGKYIEAIEKYQKAIEIDPNYVLAYHGWGNALFKLKKYEEAIEKYQKATEIDPKYVFAYHGWGIVLFNLKKYEEAIEKYQKAIEIDPKYIFAYHGWGDALSDLKKYEEAIEKYQKATEIDPKYVFAYNGWGNALLALKKYEEAIEKYQKAIEIDPKYVYAYYNWGNALLALKKYEEAIEKYQKTIEIEPEYINAYNNWGLALSDLKKYNEAIEKYKKAIEIEPKDATSMTPVYAYSNWGNALFNLKKYEEAIEKYQKATEIDPKFSRAYYNWGNALTNLKKYEEAIEKHNKATKTGTDPIAAVYASHSIARLLWWQGKYAAGRKEWEKTRVAYETTKQEAKDSKDADYFLHYGSILHEIFREFKPAETVYNEGLELDQNHVGILTKEVRLYLEIMDEFEGSVKEIQNKEEQTNAYWRARESYNKAEGILKNQPLKKAEDVNTLLQLGMVHIAMEEYDKAEICLLEALEKDRKLATAHANLGIIYTRSRDNQDYKKAVKYFKEAYNLLNREDLTIQSNLAEAYLNAGYPNMAKVEYKKILNITPYHIESHIGLGEVYSALGADGDEDRYDKAIYHFTEGLNIAENKTDKMGSKWILKKKELAAALYSRGYARVKLYEASKIMKDESLLQSALEDFKKCFQYDPYNHKAKSAMEEIEKRFKDLSPHRPEILGPWLIFGLSAVVFISSLTSFLIGKPVTLDVGYYVLLTFGSIIFMIAGLYLPQILKLKVGGIELEKSPVEKITAPTTLRIQPFKTASSAGSSAAV